MDGRTDRRTTEPSHPISSPGAFGSGELKIIFELPAIPPLIWSSGWSLDSISMELLYMLCCDPSSEPSQRDSSDERSQHKVSMRSKKNYPSFVIKYFHLSSALT